MTTLVAVHGNGGGGFRFARAEEHMPEGIRFVAVTLPGFGGRAADPALRHLGDFSEALWGEIRDLPRPLVVLGHGIGGSIALDLVNRHPVDGLILHAPVGTRLERRWFPRLMRPNAVRRLVQWGISSRLTRPLLRRRFFGGSVPAEYADRFLAEYGRAEAFGQMFDIITPEWWESLQPAAVPALLLWGGGDRVLGADQLADYERLLPDHAVDVIAGWGHFPMVTDPAEYALRIGDWAQRLAARSHRAVLPLGSGRAEATAAPKAGLLDRAAAAGLPVPPGFVVPDGEQAPQAPPWTGERLAVRSAFAAEDGVETAMAGHFETLLRVEPGRLAGAVAEVRASGDPGLGRRDVLVMRMVEAAHAGVAFSERGYADDLVEFVEGTAERLVGGTAAGTRLDLRRLLQGERPDRKDWQGRLARLLRDVRSEFGDEDWDVEWADDGTTCWLIQIRPVTAAVRRDDWFTMANHREILPDPPSPFMTSIIAGGAHEIFDYYRRFDPSLSDHRLFIEVFDHRPMINLSLMTDFMRSLGLPTRLVTDSIGGGAEADSPLRVGRMLRRLPVLLRLLGAQIRAVPYARGRLAELRDLVASPAGSAGEAVARARAGYVATVHGMTALNTAAAAPTGLLRAAGTLEAHGARQETEATAMFRALDRLRSGLSEDERRDLAGGTLPGSEGFRAGWSAWMERYGHRGAYESDLSRPRYSEAPQPVIDSLVRGRPFDHRPPRWSPAQILTLPLWWAARGPMARREHFRSEAMRVFRSLRFDLIHQAGLAGVDAEDLWMLTADEVRGLDDGWRPSQDLIEGRRREYREAAARSVPDLLSRFGSHTERGSGSGIGLVAGTVEGIAWVATEPSTEPPNGVDEVVLVAPSVDAGWLPTFSMVSAVAVEMGGDLSHGSIILREVGLPAVTNAAGLRARISTGDRVRLDGSAGTVERIG